MQIQIEQTGDETRITLPPEVKEVRIKCGLDERKLLTVTEFGFGKRTYAEEWRVQKRGGRGVPAMNVTKKTGPIVGALLMLDNQDVMIITKLGQMIRTPVSNISVSGRKTQGVKLINLSKGDLVQSIAAVPMDEENPA